MINKLVIFALLVCAGCNQQNDEIKIIKTTTNCRDTLVEIETIKYVPRTDLNKDYVSSTIIESHPDELFKDGKTRDTITRTTIEYYNP
jgi:hypothetical protein